MKFLAAAATICAAAGAHAGTLANLDAVEVVATGLSRPLGFVQDPLDPTIQYIVEQGGIVRILDDGVLLPTPFMNISGLLGSSSGERGLLGLAFDPGYDGVTNRSIYVNYTQTTTGTDTHVSHFLTNSSNRFDVVETSETVILDIDQPFTNHNGGNILFGPDGYLHIGMGDGGSAGDPGNRSQTPSTLLGKMLRIDVNGPSYSNPASNPFFGADSLGALDEIYHFGVRNPWRWSFDDFGRNHTDDLIIADVGQNAIEEVSVAPGNVGGLNFGWKRFEGNNLFSSGTALAFGPHTPPVHTYSHAFGVSITGGYVYRGPTMCSFFGRYFFADFQFARIWSMNPDGTDVVEHTSDLFPGGAPLVSAFGRDAKGELYILGYSPGRVYRITSDDPALPGDVSMDGETNFTDLNIVLSGFGDEYDFTDLNELLSAFGDVCGE